MFSSVVSGAVYGVHSYLMHIETDISDGLPMFTMVGFVSAQVREAGERVRVAMRNTGIHLPPKRITVNLTPAEIPKRDVIADLPVAIGILIAMGLLDQRAVKDVFIAGGLSLDGVVTPVRGVLPMVLEAKERGMKVFLLPRENVKEGAAVHGIHAVGVTTLEEAFHYLRLPKEERDSFLPPEPEKMLSHETEEKQERMDLSDVCGQDGVKRALEIAAAGFHNVLMIGPPGSGKSMMARCLPGILPELTYEESLEISSVYSIAGELPEGVRSSERGPLWLRTTPLRSRHWSEEEIIRDPEPYRLRTGEYCFWMSSRNSEGRA
ncbi:magnesium chelatase domain-containing protein [Bacillota bacterium HCP3S3_F1_1]